MKKKIYISKSKLSRPDNIIAVKNAIEKHLPDFEITTFEGGKYTTELLNQADYLFVIPPIITEYGNGDELLHVGKGIYTEMYEFKNPHHIYVLYSNIEVGDNTIPVLKISSDEFVATAVNWTDNYAHLHIDDFVSMEQDIDFISYFKDNFYPKPVNPFGIF